MDVERQVEYWRSGSTEDFDVAVSLTRKHPRHALFFAHLALEKMLKAHVTAATKSTPPRIHDLLRLAESGGITLSQEQRDSRASLQKYAIEGRYPDAQLAPLEKGEVQAALRTAKEILAWLQSQLS